MLPRLFPKRPSPEAKALYNAIVSQARQPVLYQELGVPDTIDGRFDSILLHAALAIGRLQNEKREGAALSQGLFDVMFRDMDLNLREIGISDNSIGKHFKRMSKAFNGRIRIYSQMLQGEDREGLTEALKKNLYRKSAANEEQMKAMADYAFQQFQFMQKLNTSQIFEGKLEFAAING